jgi:hypothetical protein
MPDETHLDTIGNSGDVASKIEIRDIVQGRYSVKHRVRLLVAPNRRFVAGARQRLLEPEFE